MLSCSSLAAEKEDGAKDYAISPHSKFLVESIYGIRLCPELMPFLNLNQKDAEYAAQLAPEIKIQLAKYLSGPRYEKSKIAHARKIGDFILIFYAQEEIADGGFELVYSIKDAKVLGNFQGDYRG